MKQFFEKIWNLFWDWMQADGFLHAVCSFGIVCAVYVCTFNMGWSVGVGLLVGIAKEVIDLTIRKQTLSYNHIHDLWCDVIGVMLAWLWIVLTL